MIFLLDGNNRSIFPLFLSFLPANSNISGPIYSVAFGLYPASVIYALLHLIVPWLDTARS